LEKYHENGNTIHIICILTTTSLGGGGGGGRGGGGGGGGGGPGRPIQTQEENSHERPSPDGSERAISVGEDLLEGVIEGVPRIVQ
jgi:hypothetical protein